MIAANVSIADFDAQCRGSVDGAPTTADRWRAESLVRARKLTIGRVIDRLAF